MVLELALWPAALLGVLVFGFLPGPILRLIVRIYPKEHPRRRELVAELYALDYHKRLLFVAQNLELALFEGLPMRWRSRHAGTTLDAPRSLTEAEFLGPQVCEVVGITYRQLDYWARTDLVRPSVASACGSGAQRRYSYADLLELKLIKHLLDSGVPLQSARKAIAYLRENVGGIGTAKPFDVLNIVHLAGIKDDVDAAILRLPRTPPAPRA